MLFAVAADFGQASHHSHQPQPWPSAPVPWLFSSKKEASLLQACSLIILWPGSLEVGRVVKVAVFSSSLHGGDYYLSTFHTSKTTPSVVFVARAVSRWQSSPSLSGAVLGWRYKGGRGAGRQCKCRNEICPGFSFQISVCSLFW